MLVSLLLGIEVTLQKKYLLGVNHVKDEDLLTNMCSGTAGEPSCKGSRLQGAFVCRSV